MGASEDVAAAIGAANDGVITTADLRLAGLGPMALQSLRRRGVVVHVGKGVDRLRDHPVTWRTRCRIALALAGPAAVLGLRSAARLHGFYAYCDAQEVEVLVVRGVDHRASHGRIVQTRWLPADHVTVVDGLPCTTAARTFFDLCGDPDFGLSVAHPAHERAMVRVYNDALARRGLSFVQEAAMLLALARRGRPGTQLVRALLLRFGPQYEPTRSDTETTFFELVAAGGLPEPEKQVVISDERGFIGTVDFLWRDVKLVVEVDSSWHDGPLDREVDEERDRRLVAAGYVVLRYRYGDLVAHSGRVLAQLGALVGSDVQRLPPIRVGSGA